ncbi:hypothetical protein [Micromonospora sp. NPDC006431]|uniref:hypothetical protein n=1 Tax=Micromonospora sp. NPDC006431 TaxID=3364235 RepID=UPI00368FE92A
MDQAALIALLSESPDPYPDCLAALEAGWPFTVFDKSERASHFAAIYQFREELVKENGGPTAGWHPGLEALAAAGDQPVRVGVVRVADPPRSFILFLSVDASAVVACIGTRPAASSGP